MNNQFFIEKANVTPFMTTLAHYEITDDVVFPLHGGNRFHLKLGDGTMVPIENMYLENFQQIVASRRLRNVELLIMGSGEHQRGFIVDGRVPRDWLINNKGD